MTSLPRSIFHVLQLMLGWLVLFIATAWTFGALWFDFPVTSMRHPMAIGFVMAVLLALILIRPRWKAKAGVAATIVLVIAWWLTLKPSNDRDWQLDVAQLPWRNCRGRA